MPTQSNTTSTNTTSPTSPDLRATYLDLATGFGSVLDAVPAERWSSPSPCPGWTARDVVGHVVDTQRDFLAKHDVELPSTPTLDEPAAVWAAHSAAVADVLADPAVGGRPFDGHFGPTTVGETLVRFYGFDMVAHRWDVATAAQQRLDFTDDELTMLEQAADGFGEALYSEGVCARIQIPADADRQTLLLARLGRG